MADKSLRAAEPDEPGRDDVPGVPIFLLPNVVPDQIWDARNGVPTEAALPFL